MTTPTHSGPGQLARPEHSADPTEGNARLTALTGVLLLVLFAAEIVTEILGVRNVLTAHVVIGYLLAPPVLVKLGSTGWRMAKYYRGDPDYRRRGAPPTYLRVLGPVIVVLTVALVGSGILTYNGPHSLHTLALDVHKVTFYLWLVAVVAHVVPHFLDAVGQAAADLLGRAGVRVPGAAARRALVLGALVLGALLAIALSGHAGSYLALFPKHH
ncbi:hypothetical protein KDK95_02165 [Actinospica sp. MGRD01-02]|uniref:Uncharacterized protein n=1 Tax=Actinospica acidithermotolerans TaxID=2828514 RepID=A0A941E2R3_9ACTN|nr:hypothetical protein [Actinospica acidithermotolerans]MBR7825095.1 hypothetical protein [Actinospica acidithermotolerans]